MIKLSNHLLEIRIKPDSRFLDKRGSIAANLSDNKFNHWTISRNRIDFTSESYPKLSAFFSFANLGVTSQYPIKKGEFEKSAIDFIKLSWTHFDTSKIIRLGIKSTFLIETKNFTNTFLNFKNNFLKLNDENIKKISGELIDIGFPLSFMDGDNYVNLFTGPMEKKQSQNYFGESAFNSGIFIDIDYFREELSPYITLKNITDFVKAGLEKSEDIVNTVYKIIDEK